MFWFLVALLFVSEAAYEVLPDALQQAAEWSVVQWQLVILAAIGYASNTYENTYRKAAMMMAMLWAFYIAATDFWLPDNPRWIGGAEAIFFLGWLGYALWRTKKIQSLPEARQFLRDAGQPDRRAGRR